MFSRAFHQLLWFLIWAALGIGVLYATVLVCTGNYLGCKAAFELLGYESQPLSSDTLIGPVLDGFFGEATLAQLLALCLVIAEAMSLYFLVHFGMDILRLWEIRTEQGLLKDQQQVRAANRLIIRNGIFVALFGACATLLIVWDVGLFLYRSLAGAYGLEDAAQATAAVQRWSIEIKQNGHMFAWDLLRSAGIGYVAATAGCCVGLEVCTGQLSERLIAFLEPIDRAFAQAPRDDQPAPGRVEAAAQEPEFVAQTAASGTASGNGRPKQTTSDAVPAGNGTATNGDVGTARNDAEGQLFETPTMGQTERPAPGKPVERNPEPIRHDVIGSSSGERISMAEALAHPASYYVHPGTGQVWSRAYWDALNGTAGEATPEEATT